LHHCIATDLLFLLEGMIEKEVSLGNFDWEEVIGCSSTELYMMMRILAKAMSRIIILQV